MGKISVIIVNYNTRPYLERCIRSLLHFGAGVIERIIVVDNASTDGSVQFVMQEFEGIEVISNKRNVGFAAANNQAIKLIDTKYIWLINSDVEILNDTAQVLTDFLETHEKTAVVGPMCLNSDLTAGLSYGYFPTIWMYLRDLLSLHLFLRLFKTIRYPSMTPPKNVNKPIQVDCVIGAAMMVRRQAIQEVGLLDEGYFAFSEEVDWCYRFKKSGWKVFFLPSAKVIHHGGKSFAQVPYSRHLHFYRSLYRFFKKHYGYRSAWLLKNIIILSCYKRIALARFPGLRGSNRLEKAQVCKDILKAHEEINLALIS